MQGGVIVNTLVLLLISVAVLFCGYVMYGGWLVKQAWSCKPLVRVGFVILALASWVVPFQKVYTTAREYGQKRSDIAWERDLTQAQSVAKGDGRLLFIDFSADWCDNCKKLEKEL